jgi:ADP-ribose pyrophosphatase
MIFKKIDKITSGHFISRYDITYEEADGTEKVYEMISRDKGLDSFERLRKKTADAVVMVVTDETGERILLNREFRLPVGDWVYNFPAGLIDPGENFLEAARRELKEETGLHLICVDDVLAESYSAVGFSNEKNIFLVGTAEGEFEESDSEFEEIRQGWYTRHEVAELLKTAHFAGRTQSFCYLWSRKGLVEDL